MRSPLTEQNSCRIEHPGGVPVYRPKAQFKEVPLGSPSGVAAVLSPRTHLIPFNDISALFWTSCAKN